MYDATIVISLERRQDRALRVKKHLEERGIKNVYYLPAYDGSLITPGVLKVVPPNRPYFSFRDEMTNLPSNQLNRFQVACTLSHVAALKFAKMLNFGPTLIVEDDVEFVEGVSERLENLSSEIAGMEWEHVYLGGAVRKIGGRTMKKVSEHLWTTAFTDGLQAYVVQGKGFDKISNAMLRFRTTNDDSMNDIMFREKDPLKAFMYLPKLAFQISDFSELDRRVVDRQDLRQ